MGFNTIEADDLDDDTQTIAEAVAWLRKNKLSRIVLEGNGGGDSGSIEEVSIYREGKGVVDDIEVPDDLKDRLESAATDMADWDWCNDEGGTICLEINAGGNYSLTGGWYENILREEEGTSGLITPGALARATEDEDEDDEASTDHASLISLNLTGEQADEISRILIAAGTPLSREVADQIEQSIRNTR